MSAIDTAAAVNPSVVSDSVPTGGSRRAPLSLSSQARTQMELPFQISMHEQWCEVSRSVASRLLTSHGLQQSSRPWDFQAKYRWNCNAFSGNGLSPGQQDSHQVTGSNKAASRIPLSLFFWEWIWCRRGKWLFKIWKSKKLRSYQKQRSWNSKSRISKKCKAETKSV